MSINITFALLVGSGVAIWVYRKFAKRASGNELIKTLAPAVISGVVVFLVTLTILWAVQ